VQLPQALGCHIDLGEGHAGDVPAWPIEIGNEARSDGVGANHEDDRDGSRRRLSCLYSVAVADYDGHLSINQICRELRKPLVLTVRPAVLDYNILAFHESCFLQAALERSHQVRRVIERSNPKKPDTGIAHCCARAASGQAAVPPSSKTKLRRRIASPATRAWPSILTIKTRKAAQRNGEWCDKVR
jgi:hypothetical protein